MGLAVACAAQALAQEPDEAAQTADTAVSYSFETEGFDELALTPPFESVSLLHAGRRDPVDSLARLSRRLRDDRETAERLLRSEGWYAATFESDMVLTAPGQARVRLRANPGERYHFATPTLEGLDSAVADRVRTLALAPAGLAADQPARNAAVLAAEQALAQWFPANGYPFSAIGTRTVTVDHATREVAVVWPVEAGTAAAFGTARFAGLRPRMQRHLARLGRFKPGEPFNQQQVDDLRQAILATGLYSSVAITPQPDVADSGIAHLLVETEPARRRTLAGSAGYGTGEGPKVELSWQHRSFLGGEERLTLLGRAGTDEQSLRADIVASNFRRRDQVLLATVGGGRLETDAFRGERALVSASLERTTNQLWQKTWVYSLGLLAEYGDFRETLRSPLTDKATWTLAAPATLRYDGTDDLFNPSRGLRVAGTLSPEMTLTAGKNVFVRTELTLSAYAPLMADGKLVAAGRVRAGSILNASLFDIPVTRRLFAGGGGSVRGFGYQGVGPTDAAGRPTGGRSLAEISAEARWRLTPTWGLAGFVDLGSVGTGAVPRMRDPRIGAGLGVRYFAPFGPVRADIATPINRRSGEPRIGVYVSIGQAF